MLWRSAGQLLSIALVLCAVFVPTAFLEGITGRFFRQFAVTIAVATALSTASARSPSARRSATLLLRPRARAAPLVGGGGPRGCGWVFPLQPRLSTMARRRGYVPGAGEWRRVILLDCSRLCALLHLPGAGGLLATRRTVSFRHRTTAIPRSHRAARRRIARSTRRGGAARDRDHRSRAPGIARVVRPGRLSPAPRAPPAPTRAPSSTVSRCPRGAPRPTATPRPAIIARRLRAPPVRCIPEAQHPRVPPPPVHGLGTAGGFKLMVEDRGRGPRELPRAGRRRLVMAPSRTPGPGRACSTALRASTPWLHLDIDRTKCMSLGVPVTTSSTRSRSTWARSMSTTSTSSAAPGR